MLQFCNQCSPRNTIICTACCLLFVYLPACFLNRDQPKVTCASLAYPVLSLSFLRFLPLLLPMLALCLLQKLQEELRELESYKAQQNEIKRQVTDVLCHAVPRGRSAALKLSHAAVCCDYMLCGPVLCLGCAYHWSLFAVHMHMLCAAHMRLMCTYDAQVEDMLAYHQGKRREAELAAALDRLNAAQGNVRARYTAVSACQRLLPVCWLWLASFSLRACLQALACAPGTFCLLAASIAAFTSHPQGNLSKPTLTTRLTLSKAALSLTRRWATRQR